MPVTLDFDAQTRILCVTLEGPADPPTFDAALQAITSATAFPPDVDTIWDFTHADFSQMRSDKLREMLAIRFRHAARGASLIALAAQEDVAFGLSRMFQQMAGIRLPAPITVVRSVVLAQRWILEQRQLLAAEKK